MEHKSGHYGRLGLMVLLSFVAMYVLMYAMVDRFANVFNSINQAYMAALMAAPMLVIELALMGSMYPNRKLNAALIAALAIFWTLIRVQGAVGDRQFLRSMIPHHAGAILMCQEASLADPGVAGLCRRIVRNQEEEIAEMKERLGKLAAR